MYKILVGKQGRKRALVRYRYRWENSIKTRLKERGCEDVDWIQLAQDRD
jgi:hypothetical protein